jgi:hypothetical protein
MLSPTLSTLDASATVLENKVQEILHDIYRTFNIPNFITITVSKTYQLVCYILGALSTSSIIDRIRIFMILL